MRSAPICDVERKGVVAALVRADGDAVHECLTAPVNSLEVEQHTLFLPLLRHAERAAIGHTLIVAADAAERCLRGKRHQNLFPVVRQLLIHFLQRLPLPQTVQILPQRAHQLRTRVLGVHVLRRHVCCPGRSNVNTCHLPARCRHAAQQHRRNT